MSSFTGPLKIKKADGTKVTFVDANGDLSVGALISMDDGDSIKDTNGNELLEATVTASAVNHIGIVNAATGNNPILRAEGEVDTGMTFDNSEGEEMLVLDAVASAVNQVKITNAATGTTGPIIAAVGETNVNLKLLAAGTGIIDATTDGIATKQAVTDITDNTPTAAQIVTALGANAASGRGFIGTIDDNDADTGMYLCVSSDASWYYLKMNKAL